MAAQKFDIILNVLMRVCFIRRLEKTFRVAYGRVVITPETRNAFLYGQLHEGLLYRLMEAPAVSGATDYSSLCLAARSEERRRVELSKRKYQSSQQFRRATDELTPSKHKHNRRGGLTIISNVLIVGGLAIKRQTLQSPRKRVPAEVTRRW